MRHVLVVDDDEDVRTALHAGLGASGFRVTTASHARDAIVLADLDRPDVVLSDVIMPGMLGMDLAPHLVQRDIPVLLMTGIPEATQHLDGVGWPHLVKPVRLDALLIEVESVLADAARNLAMMRDMFARSFRARSELRLAIGQAEDLRTRSSMARAARGREERADVLRRRIATYRRQLSEGVDVELARRYLAEVAEAEAELRRIEQERRR